MHLGVGQQQCDLLVPHDSAGQLLDAIDLLKIDGHSKDDDTSGVIDFFRAPSRHEVLDIEEDMQAWADLAAALLDQLAD
eukprot:4868692-Prymnesium_polylepis.1